MYRLAARNHLYTPCLCIEISFAGAITWCCVFANDIRLFARLKIENYSMRNRCNKVVNDVHYEDENIMSISFSRLSIIAIFVAFHSPNRTGILLTWLAQQLMNNYDIDDILDFWPDITLLGKFLWSQCIDWLILFACLDGDQSFYIEGLHVNPLCVLY